MPKRITFEGKVYTFPDDFTDDEISEALGSLAPLTGPELQQQRDTEAMQARIAKDSAGKIPLTTDTGTKMVADPRVQMRAAATEKQRAEAAANDPLVAIPNAITRGLAPYAIAGAGGAAAGSPVAGVGALPGAIAGVTALGLTDLGTSVWNLAATPFGAPRATTGSEAILALTDAANLTQPVANTPEARIANAAASMFGGGVGGAKVVELGGKALSRVPGGLGRTGNFFARPITPGVAAVSSGAGGAANQMALEAGADPAVAMGAGMLASIATGNLGGVKGGPAAPAADAAGLKARQNQAYDLGHAAGVEWTPADVRMMTDDALRAAVDPAHPKGPLPPIAISPSLRDVIRKLTDAVEESGRMDSRTLEVWRKDMGNLIGTLSQEEKLIAQRVRDYVDNYTKVPENTIQGVRGSVATARAEAEKTGTAAGAAAERLRLADADVEAATAAFRAAPTPANATARANALAARAAAKKAADEVGTVAQKAAARYDQRVAALAATDPDMKKAVAATKDASQKMAAALAETRAAQSTEATRIDTQMELEATAARLKAAYDAAVARGATGISLNGPRGKWLAAQKAADDNAALVANARANTDAAAAKLDEASAASEAALAARKAREVELTPVDDAKARMDQRNANLQEGRDLTPILRRVQELEAMPEAARASGRGAFLADQLRNDVRAFIRSEGDDFAAMPEVTRRALTRFANGGGATQHVLTFLGRLTPGRHVLGNTVTGLAGLGGYYGAGGVAGMLLSAGATALGSQAARAAANANATRSFNRVRDLVARGDMAPAGTPPQGTNRMVNYMLTQTAQGAPQ